MRETIALLLTICLVCVIDFQCSVKMASIQTNIWPLPLRMDFEHDRWAVLSTRENFTLTNSKEKNVDHVEHIFEVYRKIIFDTTPDWLTEKSPEGRFVFLSTLEVVIENDEPTSKAYPGSDSDESYFLSVNENNILIKANEVWGVVRAMETLSQLTQRFNDTLFLPLGKIDDAPRFSHRGLLVDTARHYISMNILKLHLDAMMHAKMNVFHWHLTDDESFPYVSQTYPELAQKGAFYPNLTVYTKEHISEIIEYARYRGIRVIVELDSPDHSRSWGYGKPELLTQCSLENAQNRKLVDVSNSNTWTFLANIVSELCALFPDKYIHLGGDEVGLQCWKNNEGVRKFMEDHGFSGDYQKLLVYYYQRMSEFAAKSSKDVVYWDEVAQLLHSISKPPFSLKPNNTIFQVWRASTDFKLLLSLGYRVIVSFPWYLDTISYGEDWIKYYQYELLNFEASENEKALLLGGEACIWAEFVDDNNAISRTWPRAAAMAERLWSHSFPELSPRERIDHFRCLLVSRGIGAQQVNRAGRQCPPISSYNKFNK